MNPFQSFRDAAKEQANLLRLLRCDEVQGYLFARPEPAELAAARIR